MNRFRDYVLTAAGFAVLAPVVGVFSAGPAIAQAVRAALVSNVDDPGRTPYRVAQTFTGDCSQGCANFGFKPVPAGKRLVITNVTGQVFTGVPGGTEMILSIYNAGGGEIFSNTIPMIYSGATNGRNSFGFNQQVLFFYDAGDGPVASMFIAGNTPQGSHWDITLSGYLLDCTTGPCNALQQ